MIIVRYQYIEDEDGTTSQRLQELVRERMPASATPTQVHEETTYRLQCAFESAEAHLCMFTRALAYNATLFDRAWVERLRRGVPIEVLGLTCHACEQPAEKLICNSCKSV